MEMDGMNLMHCIDNVPILDCSDLRIFRSGLGVLIMLVDGKDAFVWPAEKGTHPLCDYLLGWHIPQVGERYIKFVVFFRVTIFILNRNIQ